MTGTAEPAYMAWARERFGKTGSISSREESRTIPASAAQDRHPVLAALAPELRLTIYRRGHLIDVEPGQRLSAGCGVLFVLNGAVGLFPEGGEGICLGLAGPGSVVNVEELAHAAARRELLTLVAGAILALRGPDLSEILGRERAERLLIEQMLAQQSALDQEVLCNALHLAPARLARWLMMLHQAGGGGEIRITQAALAEMLGVQRTSVNAAARMLQKAGALRFIRGRVRILDVQMLRRQACACSSA